MSWASLVKKNIPGETPKDAEPAAKAKPDAQPARSKENSPATAAAPAEAAVTTAAAKPAAEGGAGAAPAEKDAAAAKAAPSATASPATATETAAAESPKEAAPTAEELGGGNAWRSGRLKPKPSSAAAVAGAEAAAAAGSGGSTPVSASDFKSPVLAPGEQWPSLGDEPAKDAADEAVGEDAEEGGEAVARERGKGGKTKWTQIAVDAAPKPVVSSPTREGGGDRDRRRNNNANNNRDRDRDRDRERDRNNTAAAAPTTTANPIPSHSSRTASGTAPPRQDRNKDNRGHGRGQRRKGEPDRDGNPYASGYSQQFDDALLKMAIQTQVNYYFSVDNLCKDVFLRGLMDDQGFVPLERIASFYRVRNICTDLQTIIEALRDSTVVELDETGKVKIRRKDEWERFLPPPGGFPAAETASAGTQTSAPGSGTLGVSMKSPGKLAHVDEPQFDMDEDMAAAPAHKSKPRKDKDDDDDNESVASVDDEVVHELLIMTPKREYDRTAQPFSRHDSHTVNEEMIEDGLRYYEGVLREDRDEDLPVINDKESIEAYRASMEAQRVVTASEAAAKNAAFRSHLTGNAPASGNVPPSGKRFLKAKPADLEIPPQTVSSAAVPAQPKGNKKRDRRETQPAVAPMGWVSPRKVQRGFKAPARGEGAGAGGGGGGGGRPRSRANSASSNEGGSKLSSSFENIPKLQHPSYALLEEGGFVQQKYTVFKSKCLKERSLAGPGESKMMNTLFRFWSHYLRTQFNRSMYTEFKTVAMEDLQAGQRYGMECLFRFYSYGLEEQYRQPIYEDFVSLVMRDVAEGKVYGIEKFDAYLKHRKDRGTRELVIGPELQAALDKFRAQPTAEGGPKEDFPPLRGASAGASPQTAPVVLGTSPGKSPAWGKKKADS